MEFSHVREVVGPRRTLEILAVVDAHGPINYSAIVDRVETSTDTVARGLGTLQRYDLVVRNERSARDVRYRSTETGTDVLTRVGNLETLLARSATPPQEN